MYKIFEVGPVVGLHQAPKTLFHPLGGSRLIPLDTIVFGERKFAVDGGGQRPYETGIHVLATYEEAVLYAARFNNGKSRRNLRIVKVDVFGEIRDKAGSRGGSKLVDGIRISSGAWFSATQIRADRAGKEWYAAWLASAPVRQKADLWARVRQFMVDHADHFDDPLSEFLHNDVNSRDMCEGCDIEDFRYELAESYSRELPSRVRNMADVAVSFVKSVWDDPVAFAKKLDSGYIEDGLSLWHLFEARELKVAA